VTSRTCEPCSPRHRLHRYAGHQWLEGCRAARRVRRNMVEAGWWRRRADTRAPGCRAGGGGCRSVLWLEMGRNGPSSTGERLSGVVNNVATWKPTRSAPKDQERLTITLSQAVTAAANLRGEVRWAKPAPKTGPRLPSGAACLPAARRGTLRAKWMEHTAAAFPLVAKLPCVCPGPISNRQLGAGASSHIDFSLKANLC
jgi:hypothetical protein